ncbi:MAG: hypothetical protein WA317_00310 [Mycobacterium sp.]
MTESWVLLLEIGDDLVVARPGLQHSAGRPAGRHRCARVVEVDPGVFDVEQEIAVVVGVGWRREGDRDGRDGRDGQRESNSHACIITATCRIRTPSDYF